MTAPTTENPFFQPFFYLKVIGAAMGGSILGAVCGAVIIFGQSSSSEVSDAFIEDTIIAASSAGAVLTAGAYAVDSYKKWKNATHDGQATKLLAGENP